MGETLGATVGATVGGAASLPRVGFVGVGLMGHGMAACLLAKGFPLTVLGHRNRAPVEDLVRRGAREAAEAAELGAGCDVVVLCVTGSPQVEAVVRGPKGLLSGARAGLIVCDCSTAEPASTRALAAACAAQGVAYADAPLGGTPAQAQVGALSAMVGAEPDVFARLKPVLEAFAPKLVHLGPVGAGHTMKLVNNFIALGYGVLYAEALALAAKAGLSVETVDSVLRGGRMDCGFYRTFMGWALERDPNAHAFTLANAHKDLRYVVGLGDALGMPNPVASAMKSVVAAPVAAGRGGAYVPTLADEVAAAAGTVLSTHASGDSRPDAAGVASTP